MKRIALMRARAGIATRVAWTSVILVALLAFLVREVVTQNSVIITADIWCENFLFAMRSPFLLELCNAVTLLGNVYVIIGIAGVVSLAIVFLRTGRIYIIGLAVTLLGAALSDYFMKASIGRMRPGGLIPSTVETSYSFPSGHATAAMALYGFVAFMLYRRYPKNAKAIMIVATIVIVAVGFSRLYLGVHFPSDVIAGYLLGGLWLVVGIALTDTLRKRNNTPT
jgi:membrane-associated phospholipid phosphatase